MATATTTTVTSVSNSAASAGWNKKASVNMFVNSYSIPFSMTDEAIDLRQMSANYPSGIIPLHDIHAGICSILHPRYTITPPPPYDPTADIMSPKFAYVDWKDMYLWPIFQRDVAPNHIEKITQNFDPSCILVACAIKITLHDDPSYGKEGRTVYCLWDGHHTTQVCKLMNYSKFPLWYIDIDVIPTSYITDKGYPATDQGRIEFATYVAGTNMRRINLTMKRVLSAYDDFLIGYESHDPTYRSVMSILIKNNCVVRRKADCAGAFTQIKTGISCYELEDSVGTKGLFFDRALALHRKHWPGAPLELEIFRPLSLLFQKANIEGYKLPPSFDDELGELLVAFYGDVTYAQSELKDGYWECFNKNAVTPAINNLSSQRIVMSALINLYKQHGSNATLLPAPECQWKIKQPGKIAPPTVLPSLGNENLEIDEKVL